MHRHPWRSRTNTRPWIVVAVLAFATIVLTSLIALSMDDESSMPQSGQMTETQPFRAFDASSYWNLPVPPNAPVHPSSEQIIDFLEADNSRDGCVMLAGSGENDWGTPVYWSEPSDPAHDVRSSRYPVPPEFADLRIPGTAKPSPNADSEMIIYDLEKGYVAHLSKAQHLAATNEWTVTGGSIAYLDSNGLDSRLEEADEPRNTGSFRGYNGAVAVARYDEVASGAIEHVLKLAVTTSHQEAVFPLVGSDGDSTHPLAPLQGSRVRIRPDVDLADFELPPQARVIAEALQRYGAVIADSSSGPIALKLEDTISEGRGQLWDLEPDSLCEIPIGVFEVLELGYVPLEGTAG